MPHENVDKLRAFYDAFNRDDIEAAMQYLDPEVEIYPGVSELDVRRRYHGRDGVRGFLETLSEGFDVTVELLETIDAQVTES